jgi:Zinc finger, C3HC4 type (RING finger)
MNEIQNNYVLLGLNITFQDCSIKFDSIQAISDKLPVLSLVFQRFINTYEYDFLNFHDLSKKFCGYLLIPEASKLNEVQQVVSTNLFATLSSSDTILAETVEEKAQFIYIIFSRNFNNPYQIQSSQLSFGIFQFKYEEFWSFQPNFIPFLKSLHLAQMVMLKRLSDFKVHANQYREYFSSCSLVQANKEVMLKDLKSEFSTIKTVLENQESQKNIPAQVCTLCCESLKNVVFLPCGHIAVCKNCAVEELEIELFKIFYKRANSKVCIVCKKMIKEAREIFI